MLEAKINVKENEIDVSSSGNLVEIVSDITAIMAVIYNNIDDNAKTSFDKLLKLVVDEKVYDGFVLARH